MSSLSKKPGPWFERPLAAFFESVGVLIGEDVAIALSGKEGRAAVTPCEGDAFWVETCLLASEGRAVLLMDEALVRRLGAKLLMFPEPPDDVTDEIELAFDEIVNVAIGAWNREVPEETRRWNNGVDARTMRRVDVAAAIAAESEAGLRVVGFTLAVDGENHHLALIGTGEWLPAEATIQAASAPAEPEAIAAAPDLAASPAVGAPPPLPPAGGPPGESSLGSVTPIRPLSSTHGRPPGGGGGAGPLTGSRSRPAIGAAAAAVPSFSPDIASAASADIAIVDVTGVFLQWFYEQLRNPDFVFSHCSDNFLDTGEYRAVLLVHPRALQDAGLNFENKIIMRRS